MKNMKHKWIIGCFIFIINSLHGQETIQVIEQTYSPEKVKSIVEFIASDKLKGRDTPSEGLELAADYAAGFLENSGVQSAFGFEDYRQSVRMVYKGQPEEIILKYENEIISTHGDLLQLSGANTSLNAKVITYDPLNDKLENHDLENKIIILYLKKSDNLNPREIIERSRKIEEMARNARSKGLIEVFEEYHPYWDRFYNYFKRSRIDLDQSNQGYNDFHHFLVHDVNSAIETALGEDVEGDLGIKISGPKEKRFITNNVVGVVEGTDPILKKEFIVCSAHYDHVGVGKPDASGDSIYNGARDNAIGVMSVLLAAENISKHPLKRSVIFILFTGEEKGLLGSKWFVQESPVDLNNIVFCLNTDGGGYNDTTITTVIGKRRVDADQIFDKACEAAGLEVFDGTDDTQFLFNNSDNIMFSQKGIPSVTFSAGFRGMNEEIIKHYHQPSDEVETLNFNYVLKFAKSFGFALREIGDSDKRIFWKKEDEFYKTGKKLYQ
jgi:hypothetical protein